MGARQFRRTMFPGWLGILLVSVCLWLLFRPAPNERMLDPRHTQLPAGEYSVREVNDDGSLNLVIPESVPADGSKSAVVELLAVSLDDLENAATFLKQQTVGQRVRLRYDRRRLSEDQKRFQAYVFVGEMLLNEAVVRRGFASEATHSSDSGPMVRRIKKAEQFAREQKYGIWADDAISAVTQ